MNAEVDSVRELFSGLYGNEATKTRIAAAIEKGTLPHAFLVCGPDGSGKSTFTLEICAALNCESKKNAAHPLPSHRCESCRRIFSGGFADIKILQRQKDKQTIGVEQVRLFREDMFLSSSTSEYKIYIIKEADKMTVNAQNALLKVLEEPPSGVTVFLLTDREDGILTTIKSRTQYIAMERFSHERIISYLSKKGIIGMPPGDRVSELVMCSDGRIGRALSLIGEGGAEEARQLRALTEEIVEALKPGTPYTSLYSAIKGLPTKKDELSEALESVITAIRDLLLIKNFKDAPLMFYYDRERAMSISEAISAKRLMRVYDIFTDALRDNQSNVNIAAMTTSIGAKIKLI